MRTPPRNGSFGKKLINAAIIAGIIAASGTILALIMYQNKLNPVLNSPEDITDELISDIIANRLESLTINYEFAGCPLPLEKTISRNESDYECGSVIKSIKFIKCNSLEECEQAWGSETPRECPLDDDDEDLYADDNYKNERLARNPFWKAHSRTPLKDIRFRVILTPQVTSLACAFEGFWNLESVNIAVGPEIKDFTRTFRDALIFNAPLADWDVSGAVSMRQMFRKAKSFNQPLNSWNTGNVHDMRSMFYQAKNFNQPIGNWNTGNVWNMERMFYHAKSFNQPVGSWDTSKADNMFGMFKGALSFNQPIGSWNTGEVNEMTNMFRDAKAFNQPLNDWDVSDAFNMEHMFDNAKAFNQPLDKWAFRAGVNMRNMFDGAESFNQPLSSWKIPKNADISGIVNNAKSYTYPNPEDLRSK